MSADNWAQCPMCKETGSLREDYEIGISSGKFTVSYFAKCYPELRPGCGFEFQFQTEKVIEA